MKTVCFVVLLLFVASPLSGGIVDSGLKKISLNDKLLMKHFVETTVRLFQASHVIYFDNKPVCLASTWVNSPQRRFDEILWMRGWHAFKKHEHLFPHPNFIFSFEIDTEDSPWNSASLFIINKRL